MLPVGRMRRDAEWMLYSKKNAVVYIGLQMCQFAMGIWSPMY